MDWFEAPVALDAATARRIAQDMRRVAQADGLVHEREVKLIATFEAELGDDDEPLASGPFASEELQVTYLRSLIMVALADGRISDTEREMIDALATEQGIVAERVEAEVLAVKRRFLSVFAGVNVFRDAVVRVATDLGLSEAEVDALRQEA